MTDKKSLMVAVILLMVIIVALLGYIFRGEISEYISEKIKAPGINTVIKIEGLTSNGVKINIQTTIENKNPVTIDIEDIRVTVKGASGKIYVQETIDGADIPQNEKHTFTKVIAIPFAVIDEDYIISTIQTRAGAAGIKIPVSSTVKTQIPKLDDIFEKPHIEVTIKPVEREGLSVSIPIEIKITNPNDFGIIVDDINIDISRTNGESVGQGLIPGMSISGDSKDSSSGSIKINWNILKAIVLDRELEIKIKSKVGIQGVNRRIEIETKTKKEFRCGPVCKILDKLKPFEIIKENVKAEGLVATPPKGVTLDEIKSRLSTYLPSLPIYPYVLYNRDGLYLILSNQKDILPLKRKIVVSGRDLYFYFSACEVTGTLFENPLEEIDFGKNWRPKKFKGIIIADSVKLLEPIKATVKDINNNPEKYAFKRVKIDGSYLVATATAKYGEIEVPFGVGFLADDFGDFLEIDRTKRLKKRLLTLDPERKTWQLRQGEIIGTILYPTANILEYIDVLPSLIKERVEGRVKPVLSVDNLDDTPSETVSISELKRNAPKYWGKVVEFEGYAVGVEIPLKEVVEVVIGTPVPVNVNFRAVRIRDKLELGSAIVILGLDNEITEIRKIFGGRYRFKVAVTKIPKPILNWSCKEINCDTAFFLLNKSKLSIIPIITCSDKCKKEGYLDGYCGTRGCFRGGEPIGDCIYEIGTCCCKSYTTTTTTSSTLTTTTTTVSETTTTTSSTLTTTTTTQSTTTTVSETTTTMLSCSDACKENGYDEGTCRLLSCELWGEKNIGQHNCLRNCCCRSHTTVTL